jgi:alkylation response protein AidB-like acyl-CoA dehydrogenase
MHFTLTPEEEMVSEAARRIAANLLAPLAGRLDAGEGRAEFLENLKSLAENGFMTLNVRAEHGGAEAGTVAFALTIEELAYACASTAVTVSVTNMVGEVVQAVGSPEQRRLHLPRLLTGPMEPGTSASRRAERALTRVRSAPAPGGRTTATFSMVPRSISPAPSTPACSWSGP